LDFPICSAHKVLLVRALSHLSEASECYPESLTLTDVTPERGRRATGGFADVYKGTCLGEDIALKVFKYPLPSGVDSLDSWKRSSDNRFQNLLREFMTWQQLSHPNILPFYGIHFLEEPLETRFCLVSPWMEHGNVVEFLARQNRMASYDATDCVSLVRSFRIPFVMVALCLSRHLILQLVFSISMARKSSTGI
jgi:Protein tyrosine and serine/threonine kinase